MIAPALVEEVKRLLAEGKWSGRKIARMVGVSRGSVASIAHGRRPDYEALRREREEPDEPLGPLGRCPRCGGMVHMPCRLCSLRKRMAGCKPARRPPDSEEGSQLALLDEHRIRYEEIRRRRMAEGWGEGEG